MRRFLRKGRPSPGGFRLPIFLAVLLTLLTGLVTSQAQPDYADALYIPPACNKWYTSGNGHSFVVIHDMEGYYQDTVSYLNRCDLDTNGNYNVAVSVYYAVNSLQNGSDTHGHKENNLSDAAIGEITQMVRESNYAWHVLCWNTYMFGTEHEGFVNDPAWYTQGMYQSSASLQRHLCEKYNIAKDRNHVIGHDEHLNPTWTNWVVTNGWAFDPVCNTHTDPGQYWNWTYFMSLINADTNLTGTYWDVNKTTNGFGAAPTGTWGLSASNWNGTATGTGTPAIWVGPANAYFSADNPTNAFQVTLTETQTVYSVQVLAGNPTFNGGGLNFIGTGTYYTNYVGAGLTATFNTPFTGNGLGAPDKWGTGTAVYNAAALVGSSYFTINQGTIAIGNDAAFGTNKFFVGESTGANVVTLKSANGAAHTVANLLRLYALNFIVETNGDLTFSGPVDLVTTTHTITVNNTNTTFSGTLTNTGSIVKGGTGTLIFSGAGANTYGGITTVSNGVLKLNKTAGVNAVAGSSLVVTNAATLLLGASNQIADTVPMTLGGGIFNSGGLNETLGTLKLTASSRIDLASGTSVVKFAASSAVTWTAATTLTISNWNGSVNGGGADQLFFGTTSSGLSAGQIAQIQFVNPPGFDLGNYAAKILSTGEVVPVSTAPSFTTPPSSKTVNAGQSATFTVAATGTTPLGYQWTFNGGNISGATTSSYIATNAGTYAVVVTNVAGTITSTNATLTVNVPVSITSSPTNKTVIQGQNAVFSVVAAGTAPISYQWSFNGGNLSGATISSYTVTNAQPGNVGSYAVVVTNIAGTATSSNATLTANVPPSITTAPTNQTIILGQNATFSVVAGGTAPLSYQWRFNSGTIAGATNTSYIATNAGTYAVVVTNVAGATTSSNATLTVNGPPSIVTQPNSQNVLVGSNVVFSITASGTAPLAYQWFRGGTNISGATTNTLALANVTLDQGGNYSVIVTNLAGSATSSNALLGVYATAAPKFATPLAMINGQITINITGVPGWPYIVQWTPDLFASWNSLQTNVAPFTFIITNNVTIPTNAAGYYRALLAP